MIYVIYSISVDEFYGFHGAYFSEGKAKAEAERLEKIEENRGCSVHHFYTEGVEIKDKEYASR